MAEVSKEVGLAITTDNFSTTREHFPRSPASISPVSSRRDSLRGSHVHSGSDKSSGNNTPNSPPMRLTRKRAASLNTEAANNSHPRIENLGLNSARLTAGGAPPQTATSVREQVCLCQPDPKIPRPRNAFILYRQHYQAQVVAQHPGLANPEISKIIGEQWRDQPLEVKNEWKRLAEEEKQRHQRQYPDYRYQPRRAGKLNGARPTSAPGEEPGRCPKCGGRYISTPATPLTPFTPAYQQHHKINGGGRLPSPFGRPETPPTRDHGGYAVASPQAVPPHPASRIHRNPYPTPVIPSPMQLGPNRERERGDEMELSSPDFKRRRYNADPGPPSARGYPPPMAPYGPPMYAPQHRDARPPTSATGWGNDPRSMPLPGPGQLIHGQHPGGMEPPPRPSPVLHAYSPHPHQQVHAHVQQHAPPHQQPPHHRSNALFDESLRLPPLQTTLSPSSASPPNSSMRSDLTRQEAQARSVEAMVMTIPFINKIKVLAKISPPLLNPGPGSPIPEVRGAVIAVEGSDPVATAEVGRFIEEYLAKESELAVRSWSAADKTETEAVKTDGTPKVGTAAASGSSESFLHYLSTIHEWHRRSADMTSYITSLPSSHGDHVKIHSQSASPSLYPPAPISPSTTATSTNSIITPPSGPLTAAPGKARTPIALLPSGFSLTTSDYYASRIPINDSYAPVDHWQWAATLWRGILGPDLTIYVHGNAGEGVTPGVEIRNDCAAMVVGGTEEKTLRRMGFEVLEWIRSVGYGGAEERGFGRG